MQSLYQRTITGLIYVIVIIGSIVWSSFSFAFVFLLITILCQLEFYKLVENTNTKPQKITGVIIGAILFITNFLAIFFSYDALLFLPILLLFAIFISELFENSKNPFFNIAYTLLGIVYVALPLSLITHLSLSSNLIYQPELLLGFFFLHWSNDTGAYLIGTSIGKHRLFKRISPLKSWEGAIGGAIVALIVAYIISLFFPQLSMINWLIIAAIVIVFGTLGDLVESMFKRELNIKDSGGILPGHGGLLDRLDGVFLSAPFVVVYILLM